MNDSTGNLSDITGLPSVDDPLFVAWFAVSVSVSVVAFISFIALFLVFVFTRNLRTGCGLLIAHYLFTQFLLSVVHFNIFSVVTFINRVHNTRGEFQLCRWLQFFFSTTLHAGHYVSVFLAINRLVALVFPHRYSTLVARPTLLFMTMFPWLIALGLNLPMFFGIGAQFMPVKPFYSCGNRADTSSPLYMFLIALGVHLPLAVDMAIYIAILVHIRLHRRQREQTVPARRLMTRRYALFKILFLNAIWETLCTAPVPIINRFYPDVFARPFVHLWMRSLLYSTAVPGPMMFFVMNADYQEALRSLIDRMQDKLSVLRSSCRKNSAVGVDRSEPGR